MTDWTVSGEFDLAPASCAPTVEVTKGKSPADYRAEGDLRLDPGATAAGLVTSWRSPRNYVVSWLDREAGALVTDVVQGGKSLGRNASDLPDDFRYDTWHNVAAELRGQVLMVEVTESRLNDPVAVQRRLLPPGTGGKGAVGAAARCGPAEAANLGAAPLYDPVRHQVPPPRVGKVVYTDQFDDGTI
ncbi:MAG TPA: arabinan endo-1,5-alpha-L-arabinosidase, partial [Actinomycetes bacterium]|nr:arabinan endo-1,5-alpha-L-arabinosidase [Actinomycetes bacterium]